MIMCIVYYRVLDVSGKGVYAPTYQPRTKTKHNPNFWNRKSKSKHRKAKNTSRRKPYLGWYQLPVTIKYAQFWYSMFLPSSHRKGKQYFEIRRILLWEHELLRFSAQKRQTVNEFQVKGQWIF